MPAARPAPCLDRRFRVVLYWLDGDLESRGGSMDRIDNMKVTVTNDGPYLVEGSVPLVKQTIVADAEGNSIAWRQGEEYETQATYALCRCGQSANKPFCDGSTSGFSSTERAASREPYEAQATEQVGPSLILTDAQPLCAFARYCDVAGQIWNWWSDLAPESARQTELEAGLCPSGRLVAWDPETNAALEPEFEPSIGLVNDAPEGVAGPIWCEEASRLPVPTGQPTKYAIGSRSVDAGRRRTSHSATAPTSPSGSPPNRS